MADTQVTYEVAVELNNFYNVDLFQRGYVVLVDKQKFYIFFVIESYGTVN